MIGYVTIQNIGDTRTRLGTFSATIYGGNIFIYKKGNTKFRWQVTIQIQNLKI